MISDDGEILTNAHVVTDASSTGTPTRPLHEAKEIYVQFADRNQVEADVVGFDPFSDVALLKVDPDGLDLNPLTLGSENDVEVGDAVAAIGSPFGQNQSLSVGVVSAADRTIDSLTQFGIDGAIQTDASINPGNSGGPLLNAGGEVVGINQQIQTSSGGNEGVGFAVPIDLAERAVGQLRDGGQVSYAYAGVTTQPLYPQLAERLGIDEVDTGALVQEVESDSPAEEAGLQRRRRPDSVPGRRAHRRRRRDHRGRRPGGRGQRRPAADRFPAGSRRRGHPRHHPRRRPGAGPDHPRRAPDRPLSVPPAPPAGRAL